MKLPEKPGIEVKRYNNFSFPLTVDASRNGCVQSNLKAPGGWMGLGEQGFPCHPLGIRITKQQEAAAGGTG